ncbi:MAG: hypothetical protein Fur005_49590 [Roseiflexaceae bacterium]
MRLNHDPSEANRDRLEGSVTSSALEWPIGLVVLFATWSPQIMAWWLLPGLYCWGSMLLISYLWIVRNQPALMPWRWVWGLTVAYNLIIGVAGLVLLLPTQLALCAGIIALWTGTASLMALRLW